MPESRYPKLVAHDRVAVVIESRLHELARRGHGELKVKRQPDGIRLHFGAVAEVGSDYDIALVHSDFDTAKDYRLTMRSEELSLEERNLIAAGSVEDMFDV